MEEDKISVVMPVYNAEAWLAESIESVLQQSYGNFELVVIDDGSTDRSPEVIRSYTDSRIRVYENNRSLVGALNKGLKEATGKYIARMDADDRMHIDRLKIQHSILEDAPEITVCSTWMEHFGENIKPGFITKGGTGIIRSTLLQLISGNIIFHPTVMFRRDFLVNHGLWYENYPCAEDYKLWVEMAKKGAVFYIESQPLLYYRISDTQVSTLQRETQQVTSGQIKKEIIEWIIDCNKEEYPQVCDLYATMENLKEIQFMNDNEISNFCYSFFSKNKVKLKGIS